MNKTDLAALRRPRVPLGPLLSHFRDAPVDAVRRFMAC
jgi:hypothetical protein